MSNFLQVVLDKANSLRQSADRSRRLIEIVGSGNATGNRQFTDGLQLEGLDLTGFDLLVEDCRFSGELSFLRSHFGSVEFVNCAFAAVADPGLTNALGCSVSLRQCYMSSLRVSIDTDAVANTERGRWFIDFDLTDAQVGRSIDIRFFNDSRIAARPPGAAANDQSGIYALVRALRLRVDQDLDLAATTSGSSGVRGLSLIAPGASIGGSVNINGGSSTSGTAHLPLALNLEQTSIDGELSLDHVRLARPASRPGRPGKRRALGLTGCRIGTLVLRGPDMSEFADDSGLPELPFSTELIFFTERWALAGSYIRRILIDPATTGNAGDIDRVADYLVALAELEAAGDTNIHADEIKSRFLRNARFALERTGQTKIAAAVERRRLKDEIRSLDQAALLNKAERLPRQTPPGQQARSRADGNTRVDVAVRAAAGFAVIMIVLAAPDLVDFIPVTKIGWQPLGLLALVLALCATWIYGFRLGSFWLIYACTSGLAGWGLVQWAAPMLSHPEPSALHQYLEGSNAFFLAVLGPLALIYVSSLRSRIVLRSLIERIFRMLMLRAIGNGSEPVAALSALFSLWVILSIMFVLAVRFGYMAPEQIDAFHAEPTLYQTDLLRSAMVQADCNSPAATMADCPDPRFSAARMLPTHSVPSWFNAVDPAHELTASDLSLLEAIPITAYFHACRLNWARPNLIDATSWVSVVSEHRLQVGQSDPLRKITEPNQIKVQEIARLIDLVAPDKATARLSIANVCAKFLPAEYSTFQPFFYAADLVLPLINLRQEEEWAVRVTDPISNQGLVWAYLVLFFEMLGIVLGWACAIVLVAHVTGLSEPRRDEF